MTFFFRFFGLESRLGIQGSSSLIEKSIGCKQPVGLGLFFSFFLGVGLAKKLTGPLRFIKIPVSVRIDSCVAVFATTPFDGLATLWLLSASISLFASISRLASIVMRIFGIHGSMSLSLLCHSCKF